MTRSPNNSSPGMTPPANTRGQKPGQTTQTTTYRTKCVTCRREARLNDLELCADCAEAVPMLLGITTSGGGER
jgi:hypothetical protein